jgi:phosphoribosylglycinamide formyltransferase 1
MAFVLSNNSKSGALTRARDFGIPAYHISATTEGNDEKATIKILEIVRTHKIDLLVLAGYMKKVPQALLAELPNRILNIHPALLPAFGGEGFYGHKVHEGVIARGAQYSGITIHMVNEAYDEGQIVLQRIVPVSAGCTSDELASKVLQCEHEWFWQVVAAFATGDIIPTATKNPAMAVDTSRFLDKINPGSIANNPGSSKLGISNHGA